MSSVNALEAAIVVSTRKGPAGTRELDLLLHHAGEELLFKGDDFARTDVTPAV